jgi:hypothetical protein
MCSAANSSAVTRIINVKDCDPVCHNTMCHLCKVVELSSAPAGEKSFICACPRTSAQQRAIAVAADINDPSAAERRHFADEL